MISVLEFFSNSGYTFVECTVRRDDTICHTCNKQAQGSHIYFCTRHNDLQSFYLHITCSELPISVYLHDHLLSLQEDFIFAEDAACIMCKKRVVGSATYTCGSCNDDVDCQNFYLHKPCGEFPQQINHHKHTIHPLSLLPRPDRFTCDICYREIKVSYACVDCNFDACVFCGLEQRLLHHEGHKEHALTLMNKEAFFECEACHEKANDSSYVCTTCEFWIHKTCAFSPAIIQSPTYHHHPLTLVYSVPDIHLVFSQYCGICRRFVYRRSWMYYCHKCTYFVHMKCSTSTMSIVENEADDMDNEPDLVLFPLPSRESIFDLIVTQCCKSQVNFQGEISVAMSLTSIDPHSIEKHWSHQIHPLQQLQFTICDNDSDDSDGDRRELICNGCIQPITVSHPSYYACIQCGFFLHSFCATKLPQRLPVGALHFHPQHSLLLQMKDKFYDIVVCGVCDYSTNGFYYHCQDCDIYVDIRCAFLPTRIKHESHKHHSLVQRPASNSTCSITRYRNEVGVEYGCESCSSFLIDMRCIIIPSRTKHKYDAHPLTLRNPPFFYEGAFYCESCEERVSNQDLLFHCSESEHSYHYACGFWLNTVKLGGTIKVFIADKPHTLALVFKSPTIKRPIHTCSRCFTFFHSYCFLLECDGCGLLSCLECPLSGKLQQITLI
ncbi:uncharacterized protein LOC108214044 isoform X2 [Daucus carota subsp. sativus]|uniref:uncharacterized protein LOC108214044 isoform X2 n=1 Tax=Daucus carota subsp. sativus TaxID=79200 RepID=UPI0007EF89C7|nr:PREDICTED: uncharacterized protein LOC108214044 isoform X2 [Daucus carota subsp. sativus]